MNEHRLIARVCDALVAFCDETGRDESDGRPELGRFVFFVREFADRLHHRKEEDILFVAMIGAGLGQGDGPVARMLLEHDVIRRYIAVLKDLAAQPNPWSATDREEIERGGHAYVELLRDHIETEDSLVFPLAEKTLPPELQAQLDAACARFEASEAGSIARVTSLGEELVSRRASRGA
jgi:hemerythrin-like domain-containing protein